MPPMMGHMLSVGFGTEILYSFVIIVSALLIYYSTREMYELSSYKGIKYFREAFLFFAIAFFVKAFIQILMYSFELSDISSLSPLLIGFGTLIVFIYAGSVATLYLAYGLVCRKRPYLSGKIYLLHIIALLLALISVLYRNIGFLLLLNLILFGFAIFAAYTSQSSRKRKSQNIFVMYILLIAFWIINLIDMLLPRFLFDTKLVLYLASIGLFFIMLYKVLTRVGPR